MGIGDGGSSSSSFVSDGRPSLKQSLDPLGFFSGHGGNGGNRFSTTGIPNHRFVIHVAHLVIVSLLQVARHPRMEKTIYSLAIICFIAENEIQNKTLHYAKLATKEPLFATDQTRILSSPISGSLLRLFRSTLADHTESPSLLFG
ncbi:hypothetical protein MRB53_028799 [Persea americana]|uniref:Uncharacterized protein n=1 Tax=Persea americana TaxID=3435 RepID=A0ACC2KGJ6_PERAE|nr:hypothetical protein MRB53_028799 [Persea americana]